MKKYIIDYWTDFDDETLLEILDNTDVYYNLPSYDDVIEQLKNTVYDKEIILYIEDLMIQFINDEFILK